METLMQLWRPELELVGHTFLSLLLISQQKCTPKDFKNITKMNVVPP